MDPDFDQVVLITSPDAVEVAIGRDQLEQAGIACQVRNEGFGSLYGTGIHRLQRFAEPQLVVARKDAVRAAEILGVPVPPEAEEARRERRSGLVGWIRWVIGLD